MERKLHSLFFVTFVSICILMQGCSGKQDDLSDKLYSSPQSELVKNTNMFDIKDLPLKDSDTSLEYTPENIDWYRIPKIEAQRAVINKHTMEWKFRLHSYLCFYDGKFWAMWSHGPEIEDKPLQHIKYATSEDGLNWSQSKMIVGPDMNEEMRFIARGFWIRDGKLLALVSRDEATDKYFGPSLELRYYQWDKKSDKWLYKGVVYDDTINNFPPKKTPAGQWMMSGRDQHMNKSMLRGGTKSITDWDKASIDVPDDGAKLEEPFWWILPDNSLAAIFRDNAGSKRLYRAFSFDDGQTWSKPIKTNFPDAISKFNAIRTTRGFYILVSNPNPQHRNPLCLSISENGLVFTAIAALPIPGEGTLQYPHILEHDDYLYITYSRDKQDIEVLKIPFSAINTIRK